MLHKETKPSHSEEHEQGVATSILRKTDMISHEGQRKSTRKGYGLRERSCEKIDHRDGEDSEEKGYNSEVLFRFGERIKLVGKDEEEGRMKIRRILFIQFYLAFEIISRIVVSMDFVEPERFFVKSVEPQTEA
jgi:hypothetical protein